jgi:hypothetical protein
VSNKKTTTDSTQNTAFNQTTTPNVPSWISTPAQAMAGNVSSLQAQGPGAFTPTTSGLENQVTQGAANFTPTSNYADATGAYGAVPNVTGQSLLDNLGAYETSDKNAIVDPVLAQYDYQAGQTTAQQAAQAAQNRAFQGSRYGIQEANTAGQLAMGRASTQGGLLQNLYTTATGLSASDAQRRQDAMTANQSAAIAKAQGLTGIDTAENQQQLQEQAAQASLGQRATEEQQIQQQYPLTFAAQNEGLLSGLNPALFTGSTASGTGSSTGHETQVVSDPMGQIAGLMAGGAGLFKGVTGGGIPGIGH